MRKVVSKSLWLKRWAVLWSAGFALGVTFFFGRFAYRAARIAWASPEKWLEQAEAMLRYVGDQLRNHNGVEQFEKFFPDAGFVAYMVYGQAVTNVALAEPVSARKRAQLVEEVKWSLEQLSRPEILQTFPNTQVPNGLFFLSRRTLLLAGMHLITENVPSDLTEEYHDNCGAMADAFESSSHGLVDSFPGFCWPVDNLAALRCLRLHDEKFGTSYASVLDEWKEWAENALDPKTRTLPLRVDSETGEVLAPGRASVVALSLIELRDVDEEVFRQQYKRFRRHFGKSFLGVQTAREFADGPEGGSEIDTGPIIRGHGVLASTVGMIAAKLAGDLEAFCGPMAIIEAIGLPTKTDGMRRYLRGRVLPLDALAAYALSAVPWTKSPQRIRGLSTPPRAPWLFIAVLMATPFLTIVTAAARYWYIARKIRPLSLWRSPSPSSEGIALFWFQALLLVSLFFSTMWFPVIWSASGIAGKAACSALRLIKQGERS
jgi:hypothetical protein